MNKKFIAAAASAAIGAILSASGPASARSLLEECNLHASRDKVLACCQVHVRNTDKPYWMQERGLDCPRAVVCVAAPSKPVFSTIAYVRKPNCFIAAPENFQGTTPPTGGNGGLVGIVVLAHG